MLFSYILPPAFGQRWQLGLFFFYFFVIVYLFIGIALISDIFMDSIEVITSKTRTLIAMQPDGTKIVKKTLVWNPTLANLTLMALGSSAPEIILNIYETCITLNKWPGELGASTIVGSAAFNFLVISGVSIYAVHADNDERDQKELEEDETPHGVKKINDVGVFAITATFSLFAYIWVLIVLRDMEVELYEAVITLALMFVLLILAVSADKMRTEYMKKRAREKYGGDEPSDKSMRVPSSTTKYTPLEFYQLLLPLEMGKPIEEKDIAKAQEMKDYLKEEFNTEKIQNVNEEELK